MKVRELSPRWNRTSIQWDARQKVCTPKQAVPLIAQYLQEEPCEVVGCLLLDTKHRLLAISTISRGGLDGAVVHPREVFSRAILANAAGIILFHNHPSGDPQPSPDDQQLTERMRQAGALLGIDLLDHVIVCPDYQPVRYFSFLEAGR